MRSAAGASGWATACCVRAGASAPSAPPPASPGGRLVAFGASSVVSGERRNVVTALRAVLRMPRFGLIKQMSESKAVIGLNMLTLWKDKGTWRRWIEPLQAMLDDGTIEPVVGGVFGFEEAGAAQSM